MKVDFANLQMQYQRYKNDIDKNIQTVLDQSNYIMGEEVTCLERQLESFAGVKHAITCSSGTDALMLAMMALDIQPGDEIITTPFTFIATAEVIALMKAKPVFVDIEEDTYNIDAGKIEAAITERTKAIIPVSLFGQPAEMDVIGEIASRRAVNVIVDGAQSFGATYKGVSDSALGDISCTSFFPAKPLGCYGDGGAVFTNNNDYADKIRMLRVHGQNKRYNHKYIGIGGRLDTIQAAILLAKLPHYKMEISMRQSVARHYTNKLREQGLNTPMVKSNRTSVWAQYTVCVHHREDVQHELKKNGIPTAVHYPIPLHLQKCFQYLTGGKNYFPVAEKTASRVLSLPMNAFLSRNEINHISITIGNILKNINEQ